MRKASGIIKLAANTGNTVDFNMLLDEMWTVSQEEMNFLAEARNAYEFASNNRGVAYVKVPAIYHRYTTGKVLVMEYVGGYQIDEVDQLKAVGNTTSGTQKFCESYIKQIIDDGFFHADPHPGNVHIEDGKIVWLDLGMMGRLSEGDRRLMKGVQALADNDAGAFKEVGAGHRREYRPDQPRQALYEDIDAMMNKYVTRDMADFDLAKLMDEFISLAKENHIAMPRGMTMFSRGLLTIQGVVTLLNPGGQHHPDHGAAHRRAHVRRYRLEGLVEKDRARPAGFLAEVNGHPRADLRSLEAGEQGKGQLSGRYRFGQADPSAGPYHEQAGHCARHLGAADLVQPDLSVRHAGAAVRHTGARRHRLRNRTDFERCRHRRLLPWKEKEEKVRFK